MSKSKLLNVVKFFTVFVVFMLLCANYAGAQMTKLDLQQMYFAYLKDEGYLPVIDKDGDITFKAEGKALLISVDVEDQECFRISQLASYDENIDSVATKLKMYKAASLANSTTKIAKVSIIQHDELFVVMIEAQILVEKPADFKLHFKRMINTMVTARRSFIEAMNE
jgi:hypothetical protein